jgi:hypothetical protein
MSMMDKDMLGSSVPLSIFKAIKKMGKFVLRTASSRPTYYLARNGAVSGQKVGNALISRSGFLGHNETSCQRRRAELPATGWLVLVPLANFSGKDERDLSFVSDNDE